MTSDPLTPLRVLDLALLLIALPIFLFAPIPFLGWVVGAAVWLAWRGIGAWADRKAGSSSDPASAEPSQSRIERRVSSIADGGR